MTDFASLHRDVLITADITERTCCFEGEDVTQFGLYVKMFFANTVISECLINDISTHRALVQSMARRIVTERISPAGVREYVENELSK